INPMMVTHGESTATGVLLKGVDPDLMPKVLDLPEHIVDGSLAGLRRPDAQPPERPAGALRDPLREELDLGAPGPSDRDGGTDSLLKLMRREVDAEMRQENVAVAASASAAASAPPAPEARPSPPRPSASHAAARPGIEGEVTPAGGYKSTLPDDD